jgi:hypothetical protein
MTAAAPAPASRPRWEVADVFRLHGEAYRQAQPLSLHHQRVMHAIEVCRTAALGGHLEQCTACAYQRPVYNSCRNRNCPKCQALTKAKWLHDRCRELLPVGYFHNVFTLPHELNRLVLFNPVALYNLLFDSVAHTLQQFAAAPQYGLGGQLGFSAVLHTWDQKLQQHIHLHCVIAGGALAFDRQRWCPARPHYLFPVRELSRVFRAKFVAGLQQLFTAAKLRFPGSPSAAQTQERFRELCQRLRAKDWVVFSKKPFAGPEQVLAYLGRYTHRIAIANHRLQNLADGQVTFDYRDRKDGNQVKQLTVPAAEFIRRFLLHVVPPGFCRIRHFGFLANRGKREALQRCRELLGVPQTSPRSWPSAVAEQLLLLTGIDVTQCPQCGQQRCMVTVRLLPERPAGPAAAGPDEDSS